MEAKRHHSSVQVMFSDRGSTFLGIFFLVAMVALSLTFFILKFQKKTISFQVEKKSQNIFLNQKALKRSKIIFYPFKPKPALLFHYPANFTTKKGKNKPFLDKKVSLEKK